MKPRCATDRTWLAIISSMILVLAVGCASAGGGGGRCEGDRNQRKQKMAKRTITDSELDAMIADYQRVVAGERERMIQTVVDRLELEYDAHLATGTPFRYDVLVISGGGAMGAFGAGFFEGWGEIGSGGFVRPEFDMVTGVSTGALLAPFAFIGTDETYAAAADFYTHPELNWMKKRGWIPFLPGHVSLINDCHLQDTIRSAIDASMITALAEADAEHRLLLIGTTNLDVGAGRVFDLGAAAHRATEAEEDDRVASILIASAAIPGVFPPVELGGMLYADGGATSNLFVLSFPGRAGVFSRFLTARPGAPLPRIRVWVVVNQKLKPLHEVTQPRWISVSGRALATMTSTSQLFALALIRDLIHDIRDTWEVDIDGYLVSIPADAPDNETGNYFDPEYMRALDEIGRRMGADPSSWTQDIPSTYMVGQDWSFVEERTPPTAD